MYEGQKSDTTVWLCIKQVLDKCILNWWNNKNAEENSFALKTVRELIVHVPEGKASTLHQKIIEKQNVHFETEAHPSRTDMQQPICGPDSPLEVEQGDGEFRRSASPNPMPLAVLTRLLKVTLLDSLPYDLLLGIELHEGGPRSTPPDRPSATLIANDRKTRRDVRKSRSTTLEILQPATIQTPLNRSGGPSEMESQENFTELKKIQSFSNSGLPMGQSSREGKFYALLHRVLQKQRPSFCTNMQRLSMEREEPNQNVNYEKEAQQDTGKFQLEMVAKQSPSPNRPTLTFPPAKVMQNTGDLRTASMAVSLPGSPSHDLLSAGYHDRSLETE
ncbi:hypothetical protein R1flu_007972 [Riccia fluitans]|uniref:Uncharacterized protein n=1 Tax=Riccia fluitans TaxID=41844 RepID=A0ABD1YAE6_9MARC